MPKPGFPLDLNKEIVSAAPAKALGLTNQLIETFMNHDPTPFGLSLSKPVLSKDEGPFDGSGQARLRANGHEAPLTMYGTLNK